MRYVRIVHGHGYHFHYARPDRDRKVPSVRLADIVATTVIDERDPTAALAIAYATRIDECAHARLALADALDQLRDAAKLADDAELTGTPNMKAFRKVAAAVSAVTVLTELGPKLLATLDALEVTPKARAERDKGKTTPAATSSPIAAIRAKEDELAKRRRAKTG